MDESERVGLPAALLEPETFRMFYDRALPVVFGYSVKRCGGHVDVAADLTQETFASAVSALRRGAQVDAPLPWIVTIARRRLVDHYRRTGRGEDAHRRLEGEDVQVGPISAWSSGLTTPMTAEPTGSVFAMRVYPTIGRALSWMTRQATSMKGFARCCFSFLLGRSAFV